VSFHYSVCILPRDHLNEVSSARVAEDTRVKVLKGTSQKIVKDCKDCDGIVMGSMGDDDRAVGYGWESLV
jgi:hypothetical protein